MIPLPVLVWTAELSIWQIVLAAIPPWAAAAAAVPVASERTAANLFGAFSKSVKVTSPIIGESS